MKSADIKFDCKFFRAEIPCIPNKLRNKTCDTCDEYVKNSPRILIIKLGALGDVIRTTPLITKFKKIYPDCHISWITLSPDILPRKEINALYTFDFASVYSIQHQKFDIAINLDKEIEACSLLKDVNAVNKYGFTLTDGHIGLATPEAEHKLMTGLFDSISKTNRKSYLQEIFEICHLKFEQEEYLLNVNVALVEKWSELKKKSQGKKIVGLNTGCGKRWITRMWPEPYWKELTLKLIRQGYFPVLLGGADEDEQNRKYASETKAHYPGVFSLEEFIALSANCDIIVSAVSMMMHIAIGLKKPLILFNNIFNKYEFELYGRGEIIEPTSGCDCFYGNVCTRKQSHCMNDLSPEEVYKAIIQYS